MKALSNPNRFEIFMEIYRSNQQTNFTEEECFVYEVMEKLSLGAPTISHHLKELSNADLILTERRGKQIVAKVNNETVSQLREALVLK